MEAAPVAAARTLGAAGAGILEGEHAWCAIRGHAERMRREAPDRARIEAGEALFVGNSVADDGLDHGSMTTATRPVTERSSSARMASAAWASRKVRSICGWHRPESH